jgi:hypothetical protein
MMSGADCPPYLQIAEPLEPDQLALQVMLLTGELRMQRAAITALARLLEAAAATLTLPRGLGSESDDWGGSLS